MNSCIYRSSLKHDCGEIEVNQQNWLIDWRGRSIIASSMGTFFRWTFSLSGDSHAKINCQIFKDSQLNYKQDEYDLVSVLAIAFKVFRIFIEMSLFVLGFIETYFWIKFLFS